MPKAQSVTQVTWYVCAKKEHKGKGPDGAFGEAGWKYHQTWCKSRAARAARKAAAVAAATSPKGDVVKETFNVADGAQRGPSEKASTRRVTVAENNAKGSEVISLTDLSKTVVDIVGVVTTLAGTVTTLSTEVKNLRADVAKTLTFADSIQKFQEYLASEAVVAESEA